MNSSVVSYESNEFFDKKLGIYLAKFNNKIYLRFRECCGKLYDISGVYIKVIKKVSLEPCSYVHMGFFRREAEVRPCVKRKVLAYAIIPLENDRKIVIFDGSIAILNGEVREDLERFRILFSGEISLVEPEELVKLLEPYLEVSSNNPRD